MTLPAKEMYIILDTDGDIRERRLADMTLSETINDLRHGQFDFGLSAIICLKSDGTWSDVTRELEDEAAREMEAA